MFLDALTSASAGSLFGAALFASNMHRPAVIIDQFKLADFRMLHVFLIATGSSALALYAFEKWKAMPRPVRSNSALARFWHYDGNLLGGILLGMGMALSGACPGTAIVQLAVDVPSARTTIIGGLIGAAAYSVFGHLLKDTSREPPAPSKRTLPESTNLPESVVFMVLGAMTIAALYFTNVVEGSITTTPIVGGLLIGGAQAAALLLTGTPLGVSASYEQASKYLLYTFGTPGIAKPAWPPRAMFFSLGIFAGALTMARLGFFPSLVGLKMTIPTWQALLGGFAMVFGARTAGGCTSGHGITGLGALSLSSLVTMAGAFGGGIATRFLVALLRWG